MALLFIPWLHFHEVALVSCPTMWYLFNLKVNSMKKNISFFLITLLSTLIIVSNVTAAGISLCLDGCDKCQTRQISDCCSNMMESGQQQKKITTHSSSRDSCPQANFCGNHVPEVSFFMLSTSAGFDEIDHPEQFIFPSLLVWQAVPLIRSPYPPFRIKNRPLFIRNCSFLIWYHSSVKMACETFVYMPHNALNKLFL